MADKVVSDLLMKFVDFNDQPIIGASMTQLPKEKSDMLKGFKENYMLELTKFSFKTGLAGAEGDAASRQAKKDQSTREASEQEAKRQDYQARVQEVRIHNQNAALDRQRGGKAQDLPLPTPPKFKTPPQSLGFTQFRQNKNTEATRYPVDLKPVEFSRLVDRSSLILLDHCIKRTVFKSATLIKRKAAGGPASGEVFLRFDFHHVLLKSVEWSNDAPIEEEIEFVCRAVTLNYKPQLPDGSLGAPIHVFWKSPTDDKTSIQEETL